MILVRLGVLDGILFRSRKAFCSKRDALACLEHCKSDGNSSKSSFLTKPSGELGWFGFQWRWEFVKWDVTKPCWFCSKEWDMCIKSVIYNALSLWKSLNEQHTITSLMLVLNSNFHCVGEFSHWTGFDIFLCQEKLLKKVVHTDHCNSFKNINTTVSFHSIVFKTLDNIIFSWVIDPISAVLKGEEKHSWEKLWKCKVQQNPLKC